MPSAGSAGHALVIVVRGLVRSYVHCEVTLVPDAGTEFMTVAWRLGSAVVAPERSLTPSPRRLIEWLDGSSSDEHDQENAGEHAAEDVGQAIFNALTPEGTRRKVLNFLKRVVDAGGGVRLAIRCAESSLERVPWELVWCGPYGHLAMHDGISIVRLGDTEHDDTPIGTLGPLRIFYVDAGRAVHPPYPRLRANSRQRADLPDSLIVNKPQRPDRVHWKTVRTGLDDAKANIFHFSGHGEPSSEESEASLQFTGPQHGQAHTVTYETLGNALADADIVLAVLAACYAGVDDGWAGMGAGLLSKGVPAVVSMQDRLKDVAGDIFARELYRMLTAGESLDEAVQRGRRAVHEAGLSDWWLPVLHTRATDAIRFTAVSQHGPTSRRHSTRLSRIPLTTPVQGGHDPPFLWSPRPQELPAGAASVVLSSDARACAIVAADGTITSGILGVGATVHWWAPVTTEPGTAVIAVHAHAFSAELMVSSPAGTRVLQIDDRGRVHDWKQHPSPADSGAWMGSGFAWIGTDGSADSEDLRAPVSRLRGCRLLDVAIGDGQRLASWVHGNELVMCRTDLTSPFSDEVRSLVLDVVPDDLIVARSRTGPPSTTFLGVDDDLLGWTWDDLAELEALRDPNDGP